MMRADTELRIVQTRMEIWKVAGTMTGIVVAALGAGADLFAGALALFRWQAGVN